MQQPATGRPHPRLRADVANLNWNPRNLIVGVGRADAEDRADFPEFLGHAQAQSFGRSVTDPTLDDVLRFDSRADLDARGLRDAAFTVTAVADAA